jgi:hypothetical protein
MEIISKVGYRIGSGGLLLGFFILFNNAKDSVVESPAISFKARFVIHRV